MLELYFFEFGLKVGDFSVLLHEFDFVLGKTPATNSMVSSSDGSMSAPVGGCYKLVKFNSTYTHSFKCKPSLALGPRYHSTSLK